MRAERSLNASSMDFMVFYPVLILGVHCLCLHLLHKYRANRRNNTNHPNYGSRCSFLVAIQPLSPVQLSATPWTAARQASLSITNSWSLLKLMSVESVMPSNHLTLCHPFSSCPQSFPASGSFPATQFFASGGQRFGVSASASVLPMNIRD